MFKRILILCFAIVLISLTSCKDSNGVESNKIETPDGVQNSLYFTVANGQNSSLYKCKDGKIQLIKNGAAMFQAPIGDKIIYGQRIPGDSIVNLYVANHDLSGESKVFSYKLYEYDGVPILSRDFKFVYLYKTTESNYDSTYVIKYDLASKTCKTIINRIKYETMVELSPDGSKIAYFASNKDYRGELHICDTEGGSDIVLGTNFNDHHDLFYHLVWSVDGKYLTTCNYDKTKFYVFASNGTLVNTIDLERKPDEKYDIGYSSSIEIPGSNFAYFANDQQGNISIYKSNLTTPWYVATSPTNEIYAIPTFDNLAQRIAWISAEKTGKTSVKIMNLETKNISSSTESIYVIDSPGIDTYVFPRLYWGK